MPCARAGVTRPDQACKVAIQRQSDIGAMFTVATIRAVLAIADLAFGTPRLPLFVIRAQIGRRPLPAQLLADLRERLIVLSRAHDGCQGDAKGKIQLFGQLLVP